MTSHTERRTKRQNAEAAYRFILASGGISQDSAKEAIAGAAAVVRACQDATSPAFIAGAHGADVAVVLEKLGVDPVENREAHRLTMTAVGIYRLCRYPFGAKDVERSKGGRKVPLGGGIVGSR